jgi:hypothetical protein
MTHLCLLPREIHFPGKWEILIAMQKLSAILVNPPPVRGPQVAVLPRSGRGQLGHLHPLSRCHDRLDDVLGGDQHAPFAHLLRHAVLFWPRHTHRLKHANVCADH